MEREVAIPLFENTTLLKLKLAYIVADLGALFLSRGFSRVRR
jgi:hypothetical protein